MKTIVAVTALAVLFAFPAFAQGCKPRDIVVKDLAEKYNEVRRSYGLSSQGVLVEMFASDEGTWTIMTTDPAGITCIRVFGKNFQEDTVEEPAKGEPT